MKIPEKAAVTIIEIVSVPIFIWVLFNFPLNLFHFPRSSHEWLFLVFMVLLTVPLIEPAGFVALPFLYAIVMLYGVPATVIAVIVYTIPLAWLYYTMPSHPLGPSRLVLVFCGNICCSFFTSMAFNILKPVNFWFATLMMMAVSFVMGSLLQRPRFWLIPHFLAMGALGVVLVSWQSRYAPAVVFLIAGLLWWTAHKWRMSANTWRITQIVVLPILITVVVFIFFFEFRNRNRLEVGNLVSSGWSNSVDLGDTRCRGYQCP